ncbi:Uncharacterised protein [Bacteroides xylanisolvens]|nr:Uncharacterised protein [Bacteroides xylanisolvens]
MGAVGHAGEAGHRFALAAGGQDAEAVVSVVTKLFRLDEGAFRGFEVAEFLGDADDVHHGAAEDADFSFVSDCCVDGHLDAGDRKGCSRDSARSWSRREGTGRLCGRARRACTCR